MVLSLLQILQGYTPFITATKDNRNGQMDKQNPLRPKQIGFQADDKESSHCDPPLSDRRAIYQQLDSSLSHRVKEQCMILSRYVCTCIITEESTSRAAAIISAFVLFSRLTPTSAHTCRLNARKCAQRPKSRGLLLLYYFVYGFSPIKDKAVGCIQSLKRVTHLLS